MTYSKQTAAVTLALLEERLRRVDHILFGDHRDDNTDTQPVHPSESAITRLRSLERGLQSLGTKSPRVAEILALSQQYPTIFRADPFIDVASISLVPLVLSHEKLIHPLSTQLQLLQESSYSIPDPTATAKLVELQPRIERVRARQEQQTGQIAELRARSATAVEAWYECGTLGMAEQWVDWEERLRDAEIFVRRREAAKKREEGMV